MASTASYGETHDDFCLTARAIQVAVDWVMITNSLPEAPVKAVADELAEALRSGATSARSENVTSQFWFGTLLARAGLRPGVPGPPGRRPDFVLQGAAYPFGVEVKRPANEKSVMRNIKSAAAQLRDYGERPGFVVIDLSSAMKVDRLAMAFYDDPRTPAEAFRGTFLGVAKSISARVRGYRCTDKFGRICGLFMYCRLHAWHKSTPDSPQMTVFVESPVFDCAAGALLLDQSRAVKRALRSAMDEITLGNVRDL